jgi:hypothetical protein
MAAVGNFNAMSLFFMVLGTNTSHICLCMEAGILTISMGNGELLESNNFSVVVVKQFPALCRVNNTSGSVGARVSEI